MLPFSSFINIILCGTSLNFPGVVLSYVEYRGNEIPFLLGKVFDKLLVLLAMDGLGCHGTLSILYHQVLPTYIGIQNALIIPLHSNGGHGEDRCDNAEVGHEATETAEENSKDPIPLKKIITMISLPSPSRSPLPSPSP